MKTVTKIFLFGLFFLMLNSLFAQKEVKFEIRHWLGNVPFAFNTTSQNDNGYDFNVARLEYYLSGIEIIHDSGMVTRVPDTTFLIDPSQQTLLSLGTFSVSEVEGISFYIGVDSAYNHLDPAQYPITHPLGPKSPSMHWGWAAGYRFIAMEGKCGNSLGFDYQLHGLGDRNYFKTEIMAPMLTPYAGGVVVSLDADYAEVLSSMHMGAGVIVHGEDKEARTALLNFKIHVFTPADPTTSIEDDFASQFQLYPNPSADGQAYLKFAEPIQEKMTLTLTDMLGRQLMQQDLSAGQQEAMISVEQAGVYWVTISGSGKNLISKKLIVNM